MSESDLNSEGHRSLKVKSVITMGPFWKGKEAFLGSADTL